MKQSMKRTVWIIIMMMVLCFLIPGSPGEADQGKKQKADAPSFFSINTVYFAESVRTEGIYHGIELNQEKIDLLQAKLIKGNEIYQNVIQYKIYDDITIIRLDISGISEEGTAVFQMHLESEHYYADFDYTCEFKRFQMNEIGLKGRIISVPANKSIRFDEMNLEDILIDSNRYVERFNFVNTYNEYKATTAEYEYESYQYMIFHESGKYPFYAVLETNNMSYFVPVIIYAGQGIDSVSVHGDPITFDDVQEFDEEFLHSDDLPTASLAEPTADAEKTNQNDDEEESTGDSLLADAFGMADDEDEEDEDEEEDAGFLDTFAEKEEEPSGEEAEADGTLTKEEVAARLLAQIQDIQEHPEKQVHPDRNVFLTENSWTDHNVVYSYPVPDGFTPKNIQFVPSDEYLYYVITYSNPDNSYQMKSSVMAAKNDLYSRKKEELERIYQAHRQNENNVAGEEQFTLEDGSTLYAMTTYTLGLSPETLMLQTTTKLTILYAYDSNSVIRLDYIFLSEPGTMFDTNDLPVYTEFMPLISQLKYELPEDRSQLPDWLLTSDDFRFHVEEKPETYMLLPGKTVKLNPVYERSDLKKIVKNLAGFKYVVVDTAELERGNYVFLDESVASVGKNGTLKAGNVTEPTFISVLTQDLTTYSYKTNLYVILPKLTKLELSEQNITMYVGDSEPMTIKGIAEPESAWFYSSDPKLDHHNMDWSSGKADILSVTDNGDMTATLTALGAGKTTVNLKDILSGKQARANVTILVPVTEISIDGPETLAAGKGAAYKVALEPKNAGNKKVQWSIDADPSVATVQPNGQVKVMKDAPSGTVITLTCEAEGSATPRTATRTITVE